MIVCEHDTAVVILSYNGRHLHESFLPQIVAEAAGRYDVVLVDNASTDDTLSYVQTHFPEVKTVHLSVNKGFAHGYARGLEQISAKYYVLLSADFEVTEGWHAPLHQLMEKHEDVAAVQPKIRYYKDRKMFEYAGAGGGFMDKYGYMFCRGRMFFDLEEDRGQYDDTIEVFWASGGCLFIRSELYHRFGGLDDELYAHMEEIDLCWRLKNAGYRIAYCGESTVFHVGGSVISYGSPAKIYYNFRNSLILLTKNLPGGMLAWMLPFRLILDGIAGLRALAGGDFKQVWAIIRAHWNFFFNAGKWFGRREMSRKYATVNEVSGIYPNSIIVDYFLRKKKKFTDLDFPVKPL